MPHQPTVSEIGLANLIVYLNPAISLLNELHDAVGTPFCSAISSMALSLITAVQNVKRNKNQCMELVEHLHELIYAIVGLHINSGTSGTLPPALLHHVGKLAETLRKIHSFVEMQQEGNKIKQLLRHSEMNTLLKDCRAGLQDAIDVFKISTHDTNWNNIVETQKRADLLHQELLEFISTLTDPTVSEQSSMYQVIADSENSTNSFSFLPPKPKIFHGRETELTEIVNKLKDGSPRIAILGAGGMGKTSLARAVLHHPDVVAKYEHRLFIAADSATTYIELAAIIGGHLKLDPGKDLSKRVVHYFSKAPHCLLVLDNLETPWEPFHSRTGVEEFLSLLTDLSHLALIVTMRGAERPAKVRWTRPFLQPLKPLSDSAALQIFLDIADDSHDTGDIAKLLHLTDNMPLAIDLIAHVVDYEGCSNVLSRWETEKTALLSAGHDKRSNLDTSISLSISSPRMTSLPGARDLLSLLSILPDGLSDIELLQINLPIQSILECKSTLLGTSLAYHEDKRLKTLAPIREAVQHLYPPTRSLIQPLQKHFHSLLELYEKYLGTHEMAAVIRQITPNLGNLQHVLSNGLQKNHPDLSDTITCTISLNNFSRISGHGFCPLMDQIHLVLPQLCNHKLEAQFVTEVFLSSTYQPIPDSEQLIVQTQAHFCHFDDLILESKFYYGVGCDYAYRLTNIPEALNFLNQSLRLAKACGDMYFQARTLNTIGDIEWWISDYAAAQSHSMEAQRLAKLCANLYEEGKALSNQAICHKSMGNLQNCLVLLHRGRELLAHCGMAHSNLGKLMINREAKVYEDKSEYTAARSIYNHLTEITSMEQSPSLYGYTLLFIADIDLETGVSAQIMHKNLDKAKALFKGFDPVAEYWIEVISAGIHLREGNYAAAKTLLLECLQFCWRNNSGLMMVNCLNLFGNVRQWSNIYFSWSSTWTVMLLGHAQKFKEKLTLYRALLFLGDVFLFDGDKDTAHSLFTVALDGFTFMDVHRSRADCMLRIGDILKERGVDDKARELWKEARPLFVKSSQAKDVAQVDARLSITAHI